MGSHSETDGRKTIDKMDDLIRNLADLNRRIRNTTWMVVGLLVPLNVMLYWLLLRSE